MRVEAAIPIPEIVIRTRPYNSLKWRALMMSLYYNVEAECAKTLEYFDKWTRRGSPTFIFGPSLRAGGAAAAYGHAVAWESHLDTIAFQRCAQTRLGHLLSSVLLHATTATRIGFIDFPEDRPPTFDLEKATTATKITRYWFLRCCVPIVINFLEVGRRIPRVKEIVMRDVQLTTADFTRLFALFDQSAGMKSIETLAISRVHIKQFPFKDLERFIRVTPCLESITLRSLDCDASHLLKAILQGQNHGLQVLRLSHMQYRTPIDKRLELPRNLTHFDCSMSAFTHDSFRSLFVFLGTQLMPIPIVFQARALVIKPTFYNDLADLDFDSFSENICEFDWSLNRMPNESVPISPAIGIVCFWFILIDQLLDPNFILSLSIKYFWLMVFQST
jgi:hypothetical protein